MKRKSFQADSFRWHTPSHAWYLHAIVILALTLNGAITGIAILVNKVEIPLPDLQIAIGGNSDALTLRALLPACATVLAFISNFISMAAFKGLVDTYAKKKGLEGGLSLKRIADLSRFGGGGIVLEFSRYLILGVITLSIAAGTTASLTASLTPTPFNFGKADNFTIAGLGTFADGVNNLTCAYPEDGSNGYGNGCPVNDRYGVMFDSALLEVSGAQPLTYTRDGLSYPADLSGITGEISTLASRLVRNATNGGVGSASSNTTLSACVPRTKVTVQCIPNKGYGVEYENLGQADTAALKKELSITQFRFCPSTGCYEDWQVETIPDYGGGSTHIFGERKTESGHTVILIAATGKAAEALGTDTLVCDVEAHEELVSIEITGRTLVKGDESYCKDYNLPQARTDTMTQVTYMAQMAMQKMTGRDGRLEILTLAKDGGQGKGMALQPAIQRMVEVGATEMYTKLPTFGSTFSVPYKLGTARTRLATRSDLALLWAIPPALFFLIILLGWIFLGFSYAASVYWSPTDPVAMVVAAAAAKPGGALYLAMRNWAGADPNDILKAVPGRIRLAEVIPGHLGMALGDVEAAPAPMRGQLYGGSVIARNSMMSPQMSSAPLSPYKDQYSPDPTQVTMPTLPGNGYFPPTPQQPDLQMQQNPNQRWSAQGPY